MPPTYFYVILFIIVSIPIRAQVTSEALGYYEDALRFSEFDLYGSARTQGLAGAQTALGADLGSVYSNPAVIALFRKSTLSISPSLNLLSTNSEFQGTSTNNTKLNPSVNSMGLVLSFQKKDYEGGLWQGGNFSISLTQLNNFQNRLRYQGENNQNSLTNTFIERANGIPVETLETELDQIESLEALAYFTFLINPVVGDSLNRYFSFTQNERLQQEETINRKGSRNVWNFTYGGNLADRFYFGLGVGVDIIQYESENKYQEKVLGNQPKILEEFVLEDRLQVQGTGINFSVGFIARPFYFLRVGTSITSPSYYSLQENYSTSVVANYNDFILSNGDTLRQKVAETLPGTFKYRLLNPWRASMGLALFIGKRGFITGDIEYIAYNDMTLRDENSLTFQADNEVISKIYQPTLNYRLAGELRLKDFRLRGGYAWYQAPIKEEYLDIDLSRQYITIGVGLRLPNYFLDFALINNTFSQIESPYTLSDSSEPQIVIKNNFWRTVFTFGYYF